MKMAQKPEISILRCCVACLKDESAVCVENCNDSNIIDIYKLLVKGEIDQLGLPTLAICDFCTETLQLIIEFQKQCFKSIDSLKSKLNFIPEAIFIKEEEMDFDEVVQMNKIETIFVEEEASDGKTNLTSDDDEVFDETQPADDDESTEDIKMETEVPSLKNKVVVKKRSQIRHQCKQCNLSFFISQLKRHMVKKHRGSSRCKYCNDIFPDKEELKQHIQEEETKRPSLFCEVCSFSTKVKAELKSHITKDHMSNLPRLICDICGKGYKLRHNFKDHFIMNHMDNASIEKYLKTPKERERHQCTQCDASFHSPEALKRHILKKHEGGSQCKYCLNVFWDKEVLKQHIQEEEAKRPSLFCELCSFSTKWTKDMKNHISAHMSEVPKFICDLCGRDYKLRQGFKRHFVKYHNASKEHYLETQKKERKRHQCKQCDSSYVNAAKLKRHVMKRHQGGSICRYCHKIFVDKEEFEHHMREEETKTRPDRTLCCEQCGYTTKWKVGLRSHIKKHHSPDQPPIVCDICGKTYKLRGDFKQHFITRHMEKTFQCGECGKTFSLNHELQKHIWNFHSPEGILKGPNAIVECENCNKRMKRSSLRLHILSTHHGVRKHKCEFCTLDFINAYRLKKHMKAKHMEKTFRCNECGKKFSFNYELQRHIRNLHSPEGISKGPNAIVECEYCNKTMKNISLKLHIRYIHHGVRKHKCDVCTLDFIDAHDLKNHMRTHNPEYRKKYNDNQSQKQTKPLDRKQVIFPCKECALSFKSKPDLKQHQITTHLDKETLDKNYVSCKFCSVMLKPCSLAMHVQTKHINPKSFKCNKCEMAFSNVRGLISHQAVHDGEPKLKCNLCPRTYYRLLSLRNHFIKRHGVKYSLEDVRRVCGSAN